jgi:dTDP-4-amino-4,6-dideoxygalactose transaminase
MPVFSHLGANYNFRQALLHLKQLISPNLQHLTQLRHELYQQSNLVKLTGKLLWTHQAAISYCLASYNLGPDDIILAPSLSSQALQQAASHSQAQLVYCDLSIPNLGLTAQHIASQLVKHSKTKAVVLQHAFGYADHISAIAKVCRQQQVILISDLSHSLGAIDNQRESLLAWSDAAIISFNKGQLVDGTAGAAVVFNSSSRVNDGDSSAKSQPEITFALPQEKPQAVAKRRKIIFRDLAYPLLTQIMRRTYNLGLGRLLESWLLQANFMDQADQPRSAPGSSPDLAAANTVNSQASSQTHFLSLPAYYAPLIIDQLQHLTVNIHHRRAIAHFYLNQTQSHPSQENKLDDNLKNLVQPLVSRKQVSYGTNLYFPLWVSYPKKNLEPLLDYLAQQQIYVSKLADSPYFDRQRAAMGQENDESMSNARRLAEHIILLPTNQQVDIKQAAKIVRVISEFSSKNL